MHVTPEGIVIPEAQWLANENSWLPSNDDMDWIRSTMNQVVEPGQFASWIAPPKTGIDNQPGEFEYVKLN